MTKNGSVTLEKVYTLVDQKIGIVNESVLRLETKFDNLEQGRLSHLETSVAELQAKVLTAAGMIAFLISVTIAAITIILRK